MRSEYGSAGCLAGWRIKGHEQPQRLHKFLLCGSRRVPERRPGLRKVPRPACRVQRPHHLDRTVTLQPFVPLSVFVFSHIVCSPSRRGLPCVHRETE
ncbi:hypothetical protein E2C01_097225 [Portunus trituberculatus]|uniref:Uncharacterized protein n=1 Tax=Portunus trituberculatus TaxID=210409 RepID=A0A5B7K569_PORTR|nr:hypothetical protein [Portunus trituberculatus]